ncbi:DNA repair protein XRCC1 [Platysternon megacephalum]|uniref:DNA repair protein XRCC1 n=1 Tax=Platysternon megacephalum TaxID=55544 RepID=A0A4D9DTD6_9SAUR|nr:DNA repair protein XRCC1 [Platysternon megacephalum]
MHNPPPLCEIIQLWNVLLSALTAGMEPLYWSELVERAELAIMGTESPTMAAWCSCPALRMPPERAVSGMMPRLPAPRVWGGLPSRAFSTGTAGCIVCCATDSLGFSPEIPLLPNMVF